MEMSKEICSKCLFLLAVEKRGGKKKEKPVQIMTHFNKLVFKIEDKVKCNLLMINIFKF